MTVIGMSRPEIDRVHILRDVVAERITVREAAQVLRITRRQVFRLLKAYQAGGPAALVLRRRGKPSNRHRQLKGYCMRFIDFQPGPGTFFNSLVLGLVTSISPRLLKLTIPFTPGLERIDPVLACRHLLDEAGRMVMHRALDRQDLKEQRGAAVQRLLDHHPVRLPQGSITDPAFQPEHDHG